MCAPAPVTPPAEANDVMQDYYTLMEFARRNVQYERQQRKLQTLDEDIYSAILEYYNGSNDTTCLLYTSPSPRDYAASRMPSSA